jgi:PAS domain-containing protein
LIGTFACGVSLQLERISGTIGEYLQCDPADLEGHGWQPFLHPDDRMVVFQLAQDLQAGRAGCYDCRAQARTGDPVLHLRVRTLVVQQHGDPTGAEGLIDLAHVEPRRAIVI